MESKIDFFENGDYKFIINLIDEKISILKRYNEFNKQYLRLFDAMEELDIVLSDVQRKKFNEIVELFYRIEEYYLALAYSLGIKYARDLERI